MRAFRSTIRKAELQTASHAGRPKKSGGQLITQSGSYKIGSLPRLAIAPPGRPYKAKAEESNQSGRDVLHWRVSPH